jgi:hypothetical protein
MTRHFQSFRGGRQFSLSPRERAGVRGNEALNTRSPSQGTLDVQRSMLDIRCFPSSLHRQPDGRQFFHDGRQFSLSPRERAGVRGNEALNTRSLSQAKLDVQRSMLDVRCFPSSLHRQPRGGQFCHDGRQFSLSPRERAGVRGNTALNTPSFCQRKLDVQRSMSDVRCFHFTFSAAPPTFSRRAITLPLPSMGRGQG